MNASNTIDEPSILTCRDEFSPLPIVTTESTPADVSCDNLNKDASIASVSGDIDHQKQNATAEEGEQHKNDVSVASLKSFKKRCKKRRRGIAGSVYDRLFRDSFQFRIPLSVTADIAIGVERSKANRIKTIYRLFPNIETHIKEKKIIKEDVDDDASAQELTPTNANVEVSDGPQKKKPLPVKPTLKHVPKPSDYASVLDYLEAKYVQGIMINDEQLNPDGAAGDSDNPNDEEGGGSVYSESSFIDDTALQRTVAEQVLGHTTTTKLELMQDNDDDFFVNVGSLEVEETELTHSDYDPLQDAYKDKLSMAKRKRLAKKVALNPDSQQDNAEPLSSSKADKKPDESLSGTGEVASKKRPYNDNTESPHASSPHKKKKVQSTDESVKRSSKAVASEEKGKNVKSTPLSLTTETSKSGKKKPGRKALSDHAKMLQKNSKMKRKKVDSHMKRIEDYIRNAPDQELPRKPKEKKLRVELKCPPEKKPGDMITFSNPHVPGQKLRVKIPPNVSENGTFKVTVPVSTSENEELKKGDNRAKHNRLSRKFYELMECYAKVYDDWCDAEGEYRSYIGDAEYSSHFEKRKKFDALLPLFPNRDLKYPVDKDLLQKILRRARQNKNKRDKVVATKKMMAEAAAARAAAARQGSGKKVDEEEDDENNELNNSEGGRSDDDDDNGDDSDGNQISMNNNNLVNTAPNPSKATRTIPLPTFGTVFPSLKVNFRLEFS